ncbi:MAG: tetratricopeptide repeat protein [Chthonomonadales bacterium]
MPGHLGLSVLFDGELQFAAAFREAEAARAAAPRDANVLLSLATLYRKHHRLAEARSLAMQVVEMLPDAPEGHRVLAEALDDAFDPRRNWALAESHYLEALDRDPHDQKALEELGKLYLEEDRLRPALYCYTLLLRERPNDGQARLVIAQGYDRLGDHRTAAIQRALGYRLAALGNEVGALIIAREQYPRDLQRRVRLADLLMREGRFREALVELQADYCLSSASREARALLERAFHRLAIPLPPWLRRGEGSSAPGSVPRRAGG